MDALFQTRESALIELPDDELEMLLHDRLARVEAHITYRLEADARGFPFLRDSTWTRAFRRGFLLLEKREKVMERKYRKVLATPEELAFRAALVADYHAWKWAPDWARKHRSWPPTIEVLLASWQVEPQVLTDALASSRYAKWEMRYTVSESREARLERLRRAALKNVEDMADRPIEDRDASHIRAAALLLEDRKPSVQIHNGPSNTLNILAPSTGGADLTERLLRMREVAGNLLQKQGGPVEADAQVLPRTPEEAPQRPDRAPREDGAADAG